VFPIIDYLGIAFYLTTIVCHFPLLQCLARVCGLPDEWADRQEAATHDSEIK